MLLVQLLTWKLGEVKQQQTLAALSLVNLGAWKPGR